MVLHKEQDRIYRELMRKVSSTRSPAIHEIAHHDKGSRNSLDDDMEALSARAIELEQLKSALVSENSRAEAAEQNSLRLAGELAAEQSLRTEAEHQLEVFRQEREDRETALVAEKESIRGYCDELQQKIDALTGSLEAERQKRTVLESGILDLKASLEQHEGDMRTLGHRAEEAKAAAEKERDQRLSAEKNFNETVNAKDEELRALREELKAQKIALDLVLQEQGTAEPPPKNLEENMTAVLLGQVMSGQEAPANPPGEDTFIEELGYKDGLLRSLSNRAAIHRDRGELDRALKFHKDEERICRETGNKDGLQKSLGNQALIYRDRGDLDRAMKLHKEEERICRETGNKDGLQRSLGNQAVIHRDRGEFDRAMKLHKEKERICREIGNNKGIVISLVNQAGIFVYEKKDPKSALPLLEEAYQIAESAGFERLVKQLKNHLEKARKMDREQLG